MRKVKRFLQVQIHPQIFGSLIPHFIHTIFSKKHHEVIRDVFAYLEEGGLPQAIDILYDRAFLQQQRKLADELG